MHQAFAMTMKRPHEAFGLPTSIGRRLGELGKGAWIVAVVGLTVFVAGFYIYQVNADATKGFAVRDLEIKSTQLQDQVAALEQQSAQMQTLHHLVDQVKPLGYVPVDRMDFVDAAQGSYALAK